MSKKDSTIDMLEGTLVGLNKLSDGLMKTRGYTAENKKIKSLQKAIKKDLLYKRVPSSVCIEK